MIDQLMEKIEETRNPTLIGLDTTLALIPKELVEEYQGMGENPLEGTLEAILAFNKEIIRHIKEVVPAVKIQIAMYEQYGWQGIRVYQKTVEYAKEKGLLVIGDIKRGDILSTAEAYAAHIGRAPVNGGVVDSWGEDWVTVNPYFGTDGMLPFLQNCQKYKKGIFVLVKTSNPSGEEIQDLSCGDHKLYEIVGSLVEQWGENLKGRNGYSSVGAVVGATQPEQGARLRQQMPHTFFLVPGYGIQGGNGAWLKNYFDEEGRGAIIHSARAILSAHLDRRKYRWNQYGEAALAAAIKMKEEVVGCIR